MLVLQRATQMPGHIRTSVSHIRIACPLRLRSDFNKGYGHYFCRPQGAPTGRLFLFLPGTGTNDYMSIVKTAASVGMHAMSLDWDNHPCAAAACTVGLKPPIVLNASIANCTFNLQMARLVGPSDIPVIVVANESITGRAAALVEFLAQNEPQGNGWGQFILGAPVHGTKLNWPKTTIMGHSRGASYPPLATRLFPAERAIMTGGDGDADELEFLAWSRREATFLRPLLLCVRVGAKSRLSDIPHCCVYSSQSLRRPKSLLPQSDLHSWLRQSWAVPTVQALPGHEGQVRLIHSLAHISV
jgi:hypothetical protein